MSDLAQKKHDAEFAQRSCLRRVQPDPLRSGTGDFEAYRCDGCDWQGVVTGKERAAAQVRGGAA